MNSREVSYIYRSVFIYRLLMNLLYTGGYKRRFKKVLKLLKELHPKSILELCFGDIFIAEYCKMNNIKWKGYDLNTHFVSEAKKKNYDAECVDLSEVLEFPKSEICLMIGSLYHFNGEVESILTKMLKSSTLLIISEPIMNLSAHKNIIGWLARKSANAGNGNVPFRYNKESFLRLLDEEGRKLNFNYTILDYYKKDIIVALKKNE